MPSAWRYGTALPIERESGSDIELKPASLTTLIDSRHLPHKGDQATLARGILGGDVSIDFVPPPDGQPPTEPLEPGSELTGVQQSDALALLNQTSQSVQRYGEMAPDVRRTNEELIGQGRSAARCAWK